MVVLNNGEGRKLELTRFNEILKDFKKGRDVATGDTYSFENGFIDLKSRNALILDLE